MRVRLGTGLVVLLIALLAAGGILLLALSRQGEAVPTPPSVSPTAPLSPMPPPTFPPRPETASVPETPAPLQHVVQPGETLFGIAAAYGVSLAELIEANHIQNPDLIRPGEVLVIPGRTATGAVFPTPAGTSASPVPPPAVMTRPALPVLTTSGPVAVEIAAVLGAGDLAREMVRLRNRGATVSLEGWSLSAASGSQFLFPRLILFPEAEVVLYSGAGESTPTRLYWGRTAPAWKSGELLILRNAEGETVDTYVVP